MTLTVRHAAPEDLPTVEELCWDYRALLIDRSRDVPGIVEHYYSADSYARLMADLPEKHAPPKGAIYVADLGGRVVACGMIHEIELRVTEIKRVYTRPEARGTGAATAIFERAMMDAKNMGQSRFVLDTMIHLTEAISLYEKLGLQPAAPFYEPDPRFSDVIRFFGRDLAS